MDPIPPKQHFPWWITPILFLAAFSGTLYWLTRPTVSPSPSPQLVPTPATAPFQLNPPSQALTGIITGTDHVVRIKTRESDEFLEATPGGIIRQGETIATDEVATADVSIAPAITMTIGTGTELTFMNLIPTAILLWQKSGTVAYASRPDQPLSVRALHALITFAGASVTVENADGFVTVDVSSGEATIGIIDTTNTTHRYAVKSGEKAVINDESRSVQIR